MAKLKDILLVGLDVAFLLSIGFGMYLCITHGYFYQNNQIAFLGGIIQIIWTYTWIRIRTMSEHIPLQLVFQVNFYGLIYSIAHSIFSTIILAISYQKNNEMFQLLYYFFPYLFCWVLGIGHVLTYLCCHQVLTGVNYFVFQHTRIMTTTERAALDDLDDYLVGLSNSSEENDENSGDDSQTCFDDLQFVQHSKLSNVVQNSDESWTVCLDALITGEWIIETPWHHLFHRSCLKSSYERGSSLCPNWRKNITEPQDEFEDFCCVRSGLINESLCSTS